MTIPSFGGLGPDLVWPVGSGVVLALAVWFATRRLRLVLYVALVVLTWSFVPWWAALILAFGCCVLELGIGLWTLADRAEKRIGKRE